MELSNPVFRSADLFVAPLISFWCALDARDPSNDLHDEPRPRLLYVARDAERHQSFRVGGLAVWYLRA